MILFETTKSWNVIKGEIKMKSGCKSFDFHHVTKRNVLIISQLHI